MNTLYWGEIEDTDDIEMKPDITKEIEQAWSKELDEECREEKLEATLHSKIELPSGDPHIIYAIALHKYLDKMTKLIHLKECAIETGASLQKDQPQMPRFQAVPRKHTRNALNFMPATETDFTTGQEIEVPIFSQANVDKILRKSVCTLLAQIGYKTASDGSLIDILVDVLRDFYKILLKKLENAIKYESEHKASGFSHPIERVLVDLGMGGVMGIHNYYQTRVIKYVSLLQSRSLQLKETYDNLLSKKNQHVAKAGNDVRDEIDDNPEIHLLDGVSSSQQLETCFQLLNSFEAAQIITQNSADSDEIISASGSIALEF